MNDKNYGEPKEEWTQKWEKDELNSNNIYNLLCKIKDSMLANIIAVWPRLPEEIRVAVAAIIAPYAKEET